MEFTRYESSGSYAPTAIYMASNEAGLFLAPTFGAASSVNISIEFLAVEAFSGVNVKVIDNS